MHLRPVRIEIRGDDAGAVALHGDGPHVVGSCQVTLSGLDACDTAW